MWCFNFAFIVMLKNHWESNEGKLLTHPVIFNFCSPNSVLSRFTPEDPAAYCPGKISQILRITRDPCLILFSFIFLFIFLPALRFVSFNPVMSSSASVTVYNHLCTLIQPRMKMLCQFAPVWNRKEGAWEMKGRTKLWQSRQQDKEKGWAALFCTPIMCRWLQPTCGSTHSTQNHWLITSWIAQE